MVQDGSVFAFDFSFADHRGEHAVVFADQTEGLRAVVTAEHELQVGVIGKNRTFIIVSTTDRI